MSCFSILTAMLNGCQLTESPKHQGRTHMHYHTDRRGENKRQWEEHNVLVTQKEMVR